MELIATSTFEQYIDAIMNGAALPDKPNSRAEFYLAKIAGADVEIPDPVSRMDYYLAKLAGADVEIPTPVDRADFWLAKLCGEDVETPDPVYPLEFWLEEWAEGGGSYELKTATGSTPLTLENAVSRHIESFVRYGEIAQSDTPTPSAPVDIVCNNGALKMVNLANVAESNLDIGYYLNNNGVRTSAPSNFYTLGYIPVKPSTTYTMKTSASLNYFNTMEYDASKGFIKRTLYGSSGVPAGDTTTFTTGETTAYIRFGSNINGNPLSYAEISAITWMLTQSEIAMDYIPYGQLTVVGTPEVLSVNSQTASVADLFGTAVAMDEHELISGAVKRRFGFKVFDGTESFGQSTAYGKSCYIQSAVSSWGASKAPVLCTHFLGEDVASSTKPVNTCFFNASGHFYFRVEDNTVATFQSWLAEQYAAGTPVIVMFALNTPTTEQVTPQALSTAAGDNVVRSNVVSGMMEVQYYGKA